MQFWINVINGASAVAALAAAIFWFSSARVRIPKSKGLTFDTTDFDWLTVPVWKQSRLSATGAIFAGGAAGLQGAAILMQLFLPT